MNQEGSMSDNLDEVWSVEYEWSELPRATLMETRWSGVEDNRWSEPPRATLIETEGGDERYNRWTEPTRATLRYSEGGNGMLSFYSQISFESSNMSMSNEEEVGGLNLRRPVSGVETCWDVWTVLLSEHSLFLMTMMMTVTGIWDVWGAVLGGGTWAARAVRNNLNQVSDPRHNGNRSTIDDDLTDDLSNDRVDLNGEGGDYDEVNEIHGNNEFHKQD